jgi:hypothetical protein
MIYLVTPVGNRTKIKHRWYEDRYTLYGMTKRVQRKNKRDIYRFDALWRKRGYTLYPFQKIMVMDRKNYFLIKTS